MILRRTMELREGEQPTAHAIRLSLRVWAVERIDWPGDREHRTHCMVFGRSRSDAIRRAQAPARMGEAFHDTEWRVAEVTSGWDEPVVWPLEAVAA